MPTRKIEDERWDIEKCFHPDHNPPANRYYENGTYEHICSACGKVTRFRIKNPTF